MKLNVLAIEESVNKVFWFIATITYVVTPIYCFVAYGNAPFNIEAAKELWETKNTLLNYVKLLNA